MIPIHCKYDTLMHPKLIGYHPKNRNKHSKKQIARIAEILKYQGWRHPIIISNLSKCVVVGHGRLKAARILKETEIPIVFQEFENEDQEYAFMTSDNAIAKWAELDLSEINLDVADLGPDFNIDMLGIDSFVVEPADKGDIQDCEKCPTCGKKIKKKGD